jgi:hypothetical protein
MTASEEQLLRKERESERERERERGNHYQEKTNVEQVWSVSMLITTPKITKIN